MIRNLNESKLENFSSFAIFYQLLKSFRVSFIFQLAHVFRNDSLLNREVFDIYIKY